MSFNATKKADIRKQCDQVLVRSLEEQEKPPQRIVASDEIKEQILKTGIRKLERESKVSHHTINRIMRGEYVRRKTLAKVVKQIESSTFKH